MDTVDILNKEFSMQDFTGDQPYDEMLVRYKDIACNYARMENVIAVLSDLRTRSSYSIMVASRKCLKEEEGNGRIKFLPFGKKNFSGLCIRMIWRTSTGRNFVSTIS